MRFRTFISTLAISLVALAAVAGDTHSFVFELRAPKTLKADPLTAFDLTTEEGASGTRLRLTKRREEGDFQIFQHSFLIFSERRRAMVVRTDRQPSQVFVLSIPSKPKPADWTQWQRPTYVAKGDAGWDFMHDQNKQNRSTNAPPDCFELRFKIENSKTP
jgi:hypothetical protein